MSVLKWLRGKLERAKLAVTVFRDGLPKNEVENDKVVADVISGLRKPGFPCPSCKSQIIVGIADLLARAHIYCRSCGLEMKMDWQEDPGARSALENLRLVAEKIDRAKTYSG